MRLLFTIIQSLVIACGSVLIGIMIGISWMSILYISLGSIGLTILTNLVFRIRAYDGIVHIDKSQDNTVMQLEFCADPRRFANKDELFFKVDTETALVKGRRSNNELVEKALDEISEFY